MPQPTYQKPPVVEAIVDLRIRHQELFDIEHLRSYASRISDKFPKTSPIQFVQMNFGGATPNGEPLPVEQTKSVEIGVRLANEKNDRILQLQQGGFTLSHLAPYTSWEVLQAEAKALWNDFIQNYPSVVVTRCAVRFINRISIPRTSIELFDYFNLYPHIPKGIPQDVSGMLLQLQMPQPDLGASVAVINLALADSDQPTNTNVILDIDLFSPLPDVDSTSEELWEAFDLYRGRKNDLFEAFITDRTRELFK